MILDLVYHENENNQPVFSTPPLQIKENKQAPLANFTGIALARDLIQRLDIPSVRWGLRILKISNLSRIQTFQRTLLMHALTRRHGPDCCRRYTR